MTVKAYYIPYSQKAVTILRKAEKKLGITWSVDADECVTIKVKTAKVAALEKLIAGIV